MYHSAFGTETTQQFSPWETAHEPLVIRPAPTPTLDLSAVVRGTRTPSSSEYPSLLSESPELSFRADPSAVRRLSALSHLSIFTSTLAVSIHRTSETWLNGRRRSVPSCILDCRAPTSQLSRCSISAVSLRHLGCLSELTASARGVAGRDGIRTTRRRSPRFAVCDLPTSNPWCRPHGSRLFAGGRA